MRVLFVSKPIVPPFDDGSKCLVRDIAGALRVAEPTVMVSPGAPSLGPRVRREHVYGAASRFAPSGNALAFNRLMFGEPLDLWHFVFAPNAASSSAAHVAIRSRRSRGWKGKVVQTIASHPQSFTRALFFGDRLVALSEWTRGKLLGAGIPDAIIRVIPPCAGEPAPRATRDETLARLGIEPSALGARGGPVILYPGDLHVSSGAATVALAAAEVLRAIPGARFVFACRAKGAHAATYEAGLREALRGLEAYVHIVGSVDDMHGLVAAADIVAFPVDDLRGKVDLPIVLLEAMALGKPLVLATGGPLDELPGVRVAPRDDVALAQALIDLCNDEGARLHHGEIGKETWQRKHTPEVVAAQHDALYLELD
jgi:phosphatidylinositol alpha-1,6-mannosyltransferase